MNGILMVRPKCPKCGIGQMGGPIYFSDHTGECLITRCQSCGYSKQSPTADNKDSRIKTFDDLKKALDKKR